jgi:hypothetical protein
MNNRAARQINVLGKGMSALVLVQDDATSWLKGRDDAACVVLTDGTMVSRRWLQQNRQTQGGGKWAFGERRWMGKPEGERMIFIQ